MLRGEDSWSYLRLVRTFEVKWIVLICIERGLRAQMRAGSYLWVGIDEVRT